MGFRSVTVFPPASDCRAAVDSLAKHAPRSGASTWARRTDRPSLNRSVSPSITLDTSNDVGAAVVVLAGAAVVSGGATTCCSSIVELVTVSDAADASRSSVDAQPPAASATAAATNPARKLRHPAVPM